MHGVVFHRMSLGNLLWSARKKAEAFIFCKTGGIMVRFIASAFLFFIISNAATLSWDFTAEEKITASEATKVQHDFGELGKNDRQGLSFSYQ